MNFSFSYIDSDRGFATRFNRFVNLTGGISKELVEMRIYYLLLY